MLLCKKVYIFALSGITVHLKIDKIIATVDFLTAYRMKQIRFLPKIRLVLLWLQRGHPCQSSALPISHVFCGFGPPVG